ncbi:uncharacterized protein [Apostichopus japonicus]|uniref:uncharacterized protein isoform X2 n=1 Tax=Stichopus japonicus TaxID=307972 RepID=UPI003AB58BDA
MAKLYIFGKYLVCFYIFVHIFVAHAAVVSNIDQVGGQSVNTTIIDQLTKRLNIVIDDVIDEALKNEELGDGGSLESDLRRLKNDFRAMDKLHEEISTMIFSFLHLENEQTMTPRSLRDTGRRGDLGGVERIGNVGSTETPDVSSNTNSSVTDATTNRANDSSTGDDKIEIKTGSICYTDPCDQRRTVLIPGPPGQAGYPGERGDKGEAGLKGQAGEPGPLGLTGPPGIDGVRGESGAVGDSGEKGNQGGPGRPGRMGPRGIAGSTGQKGEPGDETDMISSRGTLYTRWGRNDCPSTSQLVYSGITSGAGMEQSGGGAGYLCLPVNPVFDHPSPGQQDQRGTIVSAEYGITMFPPFYGKNQGVPCAVCVVNERSIQMMQPARNNCPIGWTCEYYGYLMTSPSDSHRSDWICVDRNAEMTHRDTRNLSEGARLVPVEGQCGSSDGKGLPCSTYPNGKELTCAVCTL